MNVHCFYHRADLDGHCSAAIVRKWCLENRHVFVAHGVNYGEKIDWFSGEGAESVAVVVDFTPEGAYPGYVLLDMKGAYGGGVYWIDHHKTALDAVGIEAVSVSGLRDVGTAACVLTWRTFFDDWPMPAAVQWLGRYDVFDRSDKARWNLDVLPFQYGMKMRRTDPREHDSEWLWDALLAGDAAGGVKTADVIREEGAVALAFEKENNRKTARAAGYDCHFEGLLCCAINARGNSLVLDAFARPEHKMRILWAFAGGKWRVSLYENGHDDVDCGAIAKRFGGGGHKGAAGFEFKLDVMPCPAHVFRPVDLVGFGCGG